MRVVFTAGGTGGHINPALAAAGELKRRHPDAQILFIGAKDRMEATLVPNAGFELKTVKISGFYRKISLKNLFRNVQTVYHIATSSAQVKKILKEFEPDVVVGFGGYASGPAVRTAAKMGIKTAIHEQNAFPGVTNKTLAKYVDTVMLTNEAAKKYLNCKNEPTVTGLPVRNEILGADRAFARTELHLKDDDILILSMGGSQGAKIINRNIAGMITNLWKDKNLVFLHATGEYGREWMPQMLRDNGVEIGDNVRIVEYINNMEVALPAADIVISRAGASSLSEIEALGKASILIPSPNVAENHQYHNAMALVNNGAAKIIEEKDLTPEKLTFEVKELIDNSEKRLLLGENALKMAMPESKKIICDIIEKLAD